MIFAAAPSQSEMLVALILMPDVDWSRVTAFHMDEYLGLASDAPQRFGLWLRRAIFDRLPFAAVHLLEPGTDPEATAVEYADKTGCVSHRHRLLRHRLERPPRLQRPSCRPQRSLRRESREIGRRLPPATSRRSLLRPLRRRPHPRAHPHHSTFARSRPHLLLCPWSVQENRRTPHPARSNQRLSPCDRAPHPFQLVALPRRGFSLRSGRSQEAL